MARRSLVLATFIALVATALIGTLVLRSGEEASRASSQRSSFDGTSAPLPDYKLEKRIPKGVDVFDLNLGETRAYAASRNFQILGHSYLKGPWLTQFAKDNGLGAGFNTVRVYDGIAYLAGYNGPATLFGVLIADVRDPKRIKPLSFIPCNPGTRCPYLRVDPKRDLLAFGNDTSNAANPDEPPLGEPTKGGISLYDVSDPRAPKRLGFAQTNANGATHGLAMDDRYIYACADSPESKKSSYGVQELQIVDTIDPRDPRIVGRIHVQGQHKGEEYAPRDRTNPDGSPQLVWCHEVYIDGDLAYVSWRDAGMIILDVSDRTDPKVISRMDYVGPFNGTSLGAAHSTIPVPTGRPGHRKLVIHTDEIFTCPPGFGRIVDISDLTTPQVLSSLRIPGVSDVYNHETGKWTCPEGYQPIHLPWFDSRSPSLVHITWYDQGLRTWDISNPYLPKEVGYYISPKYAVRGIPGYPSDRHTREVYQDPESALIYMTDGNGGGLTVLRWAGPIPANPPIPGAR